MNFNSLLWSFCLFPLLLVRQQSLGCECNTPYELFAEERTKNLTSPNYPLEYCNNMKCTNRIKAIDNHQVVFVIKEFDTENGRDFLEVGDHASAKRKISGHSIQLPLKLCSYGSFMDLHFETDDSLTYSGFMAEYFSFQKRTHDWTEPIRDMGSTGHECSGSYPQSYNILSQIIQTLVKLIEPSQSIPITTSEAIQIANVISKISSGVYRYTNLTEIMEIITGVKESMKNDLEQQVLFFDVSADILKTNTQKLHDKIEQRVVFLQRQTNYIASRYHTDDEVKKIVQKMGLQMKHLRIETEEGFNQMKHLLMEQSTKVQPLAEDSSAGLLAPTKSLLEFKKFVVNGTERVVNRIDPISSGDDFTEQMISVLLDEVSIDHMETTQGELFSEVDHSIDQSRKRVTNRLNLMHASLSHQVQAISRSIEDIKNYLDNVEELFVSRMDEFGRTLKQMHKRMEQEKLEEFIDITKGTINAWKTMIEYASGMETKSTIAIKADRFLDHCKYPHDPLSVLEWIERSIYGDIQNDVTMISDDSFPKWKSGVVSLRNDALIMYAACLGARYTDAATIEAEIETKYNQMMADNFLQEANTVRHLHYAQWWRNNIEQLLEQFPTSKNVYHVLDELREHNDWITFDANVKEKLVILEETTSLNDYVTTEELINKIHSNDLNNSSKLNFFFCCHSHLGLCKMRSQNDMHHVCFGRTIWMGIRSDKSVLIVNWLPPFVEQSTLSIPDNFFIQQSGVGFGVADMSKYVTTWNETKSIINANSSSNSSWTVLLTDNICWWTQKTNEDCSSNQCNWQPNTGLFGSVMKVFYNANRDKCCAFCAGTPNCVAVTWTEPALCTLYSQFNRVIDQNGWFAATKLEDCTQCTYNAINSNNSNQSIAMHDSNVRTSIYMDLYNLTELQCQQNCIQAAPLCVSYSWTLVDNITSCCQLNDQHGMIGMEIGCSLNIQPIKESHLIIHNAAACERFDVRNGKVEFSSDTEPFPSDTKAQIRCLANYKLIGRAMVICETSGDWQNKPECVEIDAVMDDIDYSDVEEGSGADDE